MTNARRQFADAGRRGMTLMELLVAVAILAIMIVSVGSIVTQSQKVVSTGQAHIKTNQSAAAVAQVIREDIRRISQHGLLAITQAGAGSPRLVAITAGVTLSKTHGETGTAGVVVLGMAENTAPNTPADESILYRQGWVLKDLASTPPTDIWKSDLTDIQRLPRYDSDASDPDMDKLVTNLLNAAPPGKAGPVAGRSVAVPATTMDQINTLWQVLAPSAKLLEIAWTDGSIHNNGTPADASDDRMNWYGVAWDGSAYARHGKTDKWDEKGIDAGTVEYASGGGYRALFTRHDLTNWPKALKVKYRILDASLPNGQQDFEVICPVSQ